MKRFFFTTTVLVLLAAWASGQSSNTMPTASEQLRLFQPNRELLEDLISHTVELATSNTPAGRVKACHAVTKDLGRALKQASESDNPDRVAELGEHLAAVVELGLVPTIDDARATIPVGSAAAELNQLTQAASLDLELSVQSIRFTGKVGTSPQVGKTRERLGGAARQLTQRLRTD